MSVDLFSEYCIERKTTSKPVFWCTPMESREEFALNASRCLWSHLQCERSSLSPLQCKLASSPAEEPLSMFGPLSLCSFSALLTPVSERDL